MNTLEKHLWFNMHFCQYRCNLVQERIDQSAVNQDGELMPMIRAWKYWMDLYYANLEYFYKIQGK